MTTQAMTATEIQEMMNTDKDILNSAETYSWTKNDLNILLEEIEEYKDDVNYVTYLNKIVASLG
jgi:hypothetical protein